MMTVCNTQAVHGASQCNPGKLIFPHAFTVRKPSFGALCRRFCAAYVDILGMLACALSQSHSSVGGNLQKSLGSGAFLTLPSLQKYSSPTSSAATMGAWPARMVNIPSDSVTVTDVALPEKNICSGVIISRVNSFIFPPS